MRKEFLIAIVSGITIGIVIAFGIWRANSAINSTNTKSSPTETETSNQTQKNPEGSSELIIAHPEENDIITSSPLVVSGITKPNTLLVISGEKNDYVTKSSADGSFEEEIDLIGGVNEILFAQSDSGNVSLTKSLRVVYSTEFAKELSE
jgi:hypothetical protein